MLEKYTCLLYKFEAADEKESENSGGGRFIKKKNKNIYEFLHYLNPLT